MSCRIASGRVSSCGCPRLQASIDALADVTDWVAPARHFKCPCHESEYDPGDAARVVSGPAPWQLAALPLKIADGLLAVAAPFVGKVGFAQPGSPSGE